MPTPAPARISYPIHCTVVVLFVRVVSMLQPIIPIIGPRRVGGLKKPVLVTETPAIAEKIDIATTYGIRCTPETIASSPRTASNQIGRK